MKEINTTESHETTNGSNGKTIAWTLGAIFVSKFIEPFLSDLYHEGKEHYNEWKKKRKEANVFLIIWLAI